MNRRKFLSYVGCGCCGLILNSCSTAPITERRQLKIIPEAKLNAQAAQIYEKVKEKEKMSNDSKTLNEIKAIGKKMESSISEYFYKAKINDPTTGATIKDRIRILKSNTQPDFVSNLTYDYDWAIVKTILSSDGYVDSRKVQVGFFDVDDDGVVDNPDLFELIVAPDSDVANKFIFFQEVTENNITQDNPISNSNFIVTQ